MKCSLKSILILMLISPTLFVTSCTSSPDDTMVEEDKPVFEDVPKGILIEAIPDSVDIVFTSIRHVFNNVVFTMKISKSKTISSTYLIVILLFITKKVVSFKL